MVGIALLALAGCGRADPSPSTATLGPTTVVAVNYPLAFFAQRIGGDHVAVTMPAPPGTDPSDWQPTPEAISQIQGADVILLNGAGYAGWVGAASLPDSKVWVTSNDDRDEWIQLDQRDSAVHRHGPAGPHSHHGVASMTWLDPEIAIAQADAVRAALVRAMPEHQDLFGSNARVLARSIIEQSADIEQAINTNPTQPVLFSHPVYQYLARRFGMNGRSVHWEPREMPNEEAWSALEASLADHPAEWMIWEATPDTAIADRLQGLGIQSVVVDPGGAAPTQGDYFGSMRAAASALRRVYGAEAE